MHRFQIPGLPTDYYRQTRGNIGTYTATNTEAFRTLVAEFARHHGGTLSISDGFELIRLAKSFFQYQEKQVRSMCYREIESALDDWPDIYAEAEHKAKAAAFDIAPVRPEPKATDRAPATAKRPPRDPYGGRQPVPVPEIAKTRYTVRSVGKGCLRVVIGAYALLVVCYLIFH